MVETITTWLNKYESIAIWLEGIALVAIFVWDRLDSRKQHEETLAQLRVAQRQVDASLENANAAKLAAESVINAERAWVMAELSWYDKVHVVTGASQIRDEPRVETTHVKLKLTCRNEGRTPAWIDQVYGHLEIFGKAVKLGSVTKSECQTSGPMGPLGAGKEQSRVLEATCLGHPKSDEYLAIYTAIEYRDIFGLKRETVLGYSIDLHGEIYRQDALPERNRNT